MIQVILEMAEDRAFLQDLWPIKKAVRYCWEQNVIVVTAMGNLNEKNNSVSTYFPARYPWTIAVGGTQKTNGKLQVWEHSGKGDYIDIVAPAKDIWVEFPSYLENKLRAQKAFGNSLAAGLVSGASALILSAMKEETKAQLKSQPGKLCEKVRSIMRDTASNEVLGFNLPNPLSGYGLIEISKAVLLSKAQKTLKLPEDRHSNRAFLLDACVFLNTLSR